MTIARYGSGLMRSSVHGRVRAGFTVIELMVVVAVVGVIAAAIMPALAEVRWDSRQSGAAHDIVRMGRRARAMTMETGVAHLLRFQRGNDAGGSFGLGRFELIRGMTNRCQQTPWGQAFIEANGLGIPATRREGADLLDMISFNPTSVDPPVVPTATDENEGHQVILVTARGGTPIASQEAVQICYQPNGQTYELFSATETGTGGVRLRPQLAPITFTVTRRLSGGVRGVSRQVVFPIGGNARVRY